MSDFTENDISLLVLVLDMNPKAWAQRSSTKQTKTNNTFQETITFTMFLDHVLIFLKAYLMLQKYNALAVIATHPKRTTFLYPPSSRLSLCGSPQTVAQLQVAIDFDDLKVHMTQQVKEIMQQTDEDDFHKESSLAAALSFGLCYINRILIERPQLKPRMFVLNISPDIPSHYVFVMNAISAAQKLNVPIDSCVLNQDGSSFLQQAAHLTNGIYIKPSVPQGLLHYFLTVFVLDRYVRTILPPPNPLEVDYRTTCFCHNKIIDRGFVCSVCLSIFCEPRKDCLTCRTTFSS
jgi:transcription initiation factor TFIIH subunit 3